MLEILKKIKNAIYTSNSLKVGKMLNQNKYNYNKYVNRHYDILNILQFDLYPKAISEDNIFNEYAEKCIELCIEDLKIAPFFIEWYKKECEIINKKNSSINYGTNKYLIKILEKQERYEEAINYCNKYISLGLTDDGTKGGIIARKEKLKKKLNK